MKCFKLALLCAVLIISTSAAYSETRSFRDALDGRSMEDAISGPVDKDTSSYGDRTSSPASSSSSAGSDAGYGSAGQSNGGQQSPMTLTIPANGNLNGQMAPAMQDEQQQQQQSGGSELEREAGPIGEPSEGAQKQLMEQKLMSMMMAMNPSMAKSNRQTASRGGRLMASTVAQRSGRLQQQYVESSSMAPNGAADSYSSTPATGKTSDSQSGGFGEQEQPSSVKSKANSQYGSGKQSAAGGYGAPTTPSSMGADEDEQQQQQSPSAAMDEQQQTQEKGYSGGQDEQQEMLAKQQKAMAAMLMSMNNGMRYNSRAQGASMPANLMKLMMMSQAKSTAAGGYGDKAMKPSTMGQQGTSQMAQNMMMSLANKAAYMSGQQQRQMAPPVMMMAGQRSPASTYGSGNANGQSMGMPASMQMGYSGNSQSATSKPMSMAVLAQNGSPMRGGMRRANQRRNEKKVSPAMVNAMLNKMLSQTNKQQSGAQNEGSYEPTGKPAATMSQLAEMMKAPAGAKLMAQMMQMNGATAGMPAGKREQYKRMMMSAMLQQQQQQQQENDYGQQKESSAGADSYGAQGAAKSPSSGDSTNGEGYGAPATTPPPMAAMMMMNMMKRQYGQQMGPKSMTNKMGGDYSNSMGQQQQAEPEQQSMDGEAADGYQQQQQQQQSMAGEAATKEAGRMTTTARPAMMYSMYAPGSSTMSLMNGQANGNKYGPAPAMNSGNYGALDVAARQAKPQVPMSMSMADAYATNAAAADMPAARGYGSANGKPAGASGYGMASPVSPAAGTKSSPGQADSSYGGSTVGPRPMLAATKSSPQSSYNDADQQQTDDYGAAPMGQAEPFAFDYKIDDNYGTNQYRKEKSDENGVVRGSYGYMDNKGLYRHVEYVADENGFRANIKSNEPGLSSETKPLDGASAGNSMPGAGQQEQSVMPNGMMMANAMLGPMAAAAGGDESMGQQQQEMMMMSPVSQQQQQQQQTTDEGVKSK